MFDVNLFIERWNLYSMYNHLAWDLLGKWQTLSGETQQKLMESMAYIGRELDYELCWGADIDASEQRRFNEGLIQRIKGLIGEVESRGKTKEVGGN